MSKNLGEAVDPPMIQTIGGTIDPSGIKTTSEALIDESKLLAKLSMSGPKANGEAEDPLVSKTTCGTIDAS